MQKQTYQTGQVIELSLEDFRKEYRLNVFRVSEEDSQYNPRQLNYSRLDNIEGLIRFVLPKEAQPIQLVEAGAVYQTRNDVWDCTLEFYRENNGIFYREAKTSSERTPEIIVIQNSLTANPLPEIKTEALPIISKRRSLVSIVRSIGSNLKM